MLDIRSFRAKLTIFSLLVGAAPVLAVGTWSALQGRSTLQATTAAAEQALTDDAVQRLSAIRDTMRHALQSYGSNVASQVALLAGASHTRTAMLQLGAAFHDQIADRHLDAAAVERLRGELGQYYRTGFGAE